MRAVTAGTDGPIARLTGCFAVALGIICLAAPIAHASFGISEFDGATTEVDGTPSIQASGHPYSISTSIKFNTTLTSSGEMPDESAKDVIVDLAPGFIGNPTALPRCSEAEFSGTEIEPVCSADTVVGHAELDLNFLGGVQTFHAALFNLVPPPGVPASFGFSVVGVPVHLYGRVRSDSDYGVSIDVTDINQTLAIVRTRTTFWGVPSDPTHDEQRCSVPSTTTGVCEGGGKGESGIPHVGPLPVRPFLTNVSRCDGVPEKTLGRADSWLRPGALSFASFSAHDPVTSDPVLISGCEKVPFAPDLAVRSTSDEAGVPVGLSVDLSVPAVGIRNPAGIASSTLKRVDLRLPRGMTVNPSTAGGTAGCTESQVGLGSAAVAQCPEASRIGSVSITTPVLENELKGSVYLATPGANPFGSLLALYIAVSDPESGVVVKVAGKVAPDPSTGQLEVVFDGNPQLPFESLHLELKSGPRAPLINPKSCATFTSHADLISWARPGEVVAADSQFVVRQNCSASSRFAPALEAGTENPAAAGYSPFTLRLSRPDGQPNIASLRASLPQGLLAKLKGVPLCDPAASGTCPAASQVGHVVVGAGAGSNPIFVPEPGKSPTAVYLGGPYKGGPLSLVVTVPAQAGPFDLGTVTVRNALNIDPTTAQVTAVSDPLPQILQGIPIEYRDIRVEIDRDDFTVNPTSCEPMATTSEVASAGGQVATPQSHFQTANCERLDFKPKLGIRFSGAPPRRGGYPKLTATLTMPEGGANIRKAVVALPKTEFLENAHIRTICTRVQYAAKACPAASVYGYAKAWTPLLDEPLQGPVYLRSSSNKLPDLVASLDGQIHIDLPGRIDSPKGHIRNTFWTVPDAPVSKFQLTMQGRRKGLLVNNTNLCRAKPRANARFEGQNGKVSTSNPVVKVSGCGKKKKRK